MRRGLTYKMAPERVVRTVQSEASMGTKKQRRLGLKKETLRNLSGLTDAQLAAVAGGAYPRQYTGQCIDTSKCTETNNCATQKNCNTIGCETNACFPTGACQIE